MAVAFCDVTQGADALKCNFFYGGEAMDTLKVGMKDEMAWEVTEDLCTTRGEYRVFSTPGMTRFVEMTAHKLVGPHLKPTQGQVGLRVNIRHMAPTPIGKQVRCEVELFPAASRT